MFLSPWHAVVAAADVARSLKNAVQRLPEVPAIIARCREEKRQRDRERAAISRIVSPMLKKPGVTREQIEAALKAAGYRERKQQER